MRVGVRGRDSEREREKTAEKREKKKNRRVITRHFVIVCGKARLMTLARQKSVSGGFVDRDDNEWRLNESS